MGFTVAYRQQFKYMVHGDERWIAGMLRARIAASLKKKGAQEVAIEGQRITFKGRANDRWYWGFLLRAISTGDVTVVGQNGQLSVASEINFGYLFLVTLILTGFLTVCVIFKGMGFLGVYAFVGILWVAFFGGSVALSCLWFHFFMQGQIIEFFNSVAELGIQGQQITSR
jgi:hypothetical protein